MASCIALGVAYKLPQASSSSNQDKYLSHNHRLIPCPTHTNTNTPHTPIDLRTEVTMHTIMYVCLSQNWSHPRNYSMYLQISELKSPYKLFYIPADLRIEVTMKTIPYAYLYKHSIANLLVVECLYK